MILNLLTVLLSILTPLKVWKYFDINSEALLIENLSQFFFFIFFSILIFKNTKQKRFYRKNQRALF